MLRFYQLLFATALTLVLILSCQQITQQQWRDMTKAEGLYPDGQGYFIYFNEPVVTTSVVENRDKENAGAREKGLDLVSVSGDAAHPPTLRWRDQDRLEISFVKGTSASTVYTLQLKPGTTYLGGGQPVKSSYTFQMKPEKLIISALERPDGAVLVSGLGRISREARELSPASPITYVFRRVREFPVVGRVGTGDIPAIVSQPTVADGLGGNAATLISALHADSRLLELTPASPIPQTVMLRPAKPLVPGATYRIVAKAAPGSGLEDGKLGTITAPSPLSAEMELKDGEKGQTQLELTFNHPVAEKSLMDIFRSLRVSFDASPATLGADGKSFAANVQGRTVTLRFIEPLFPNSDSFYDSTRVSLGDGSRRVSYADAGGARGFRMALDAAPVTVDVCLPTGTVSLRGFRTPKELRFRAQSKPAWPVLAGGGTNLLPLHGDHCVRLPFINVASATACAYRWEAQDAAQLLPLIVRSLRDQTVRRELELNRANLKLRRSLGLDADGGALANVDDALDTLREDEKAQEPLRRQALAKATSFPAQSLALVAGKDDGKAQRGEVVVDLKRLTGGSVRPGLYLISVTSRPNARVLGGLPLLKLKPDALDCTVDYLLQVTDLNAVHDDGQVLVNRLSDGGVPAGVSMQVFRLPDYAKKIKNPYLQPATATGQMLPICEGRALFRLGKEESTGSSATDARILLFRRGDDYRLLYSNCRGVTDKNANDQPTDRCHLLADRPLYRPGDTAHIHGTVRRTGKADCRLPSVRKAKLLFLKPDKSLLESRDVVLDSFGAFAVGFTLPEGEEDVAGNYTCHLVLDGEAAAESAAEPDSEDTDEFSLTIPCQVFRRDAFAAELSLEVDPVAPQSFTVTVKARDYNGTPLSGGKVALDIESPVVLRDGQGRVLSESTFETSETEGYEVESLHHELVLDAAGEGHFSARMDAIKTEANRNITVSASVANDREEYVKMEPVSQAVYPADVCLRFDVEENRMKLLAPRTLAPLARAQVVQIDRMESVERTERRNTGLVFHYSEDVCRESHTVTVPADCAEGVSLAGIFEPLEAISDNFYRFRMTDPEGRVAEYRVNPMEEWKKTGKRGDQRGDAVVLSADIPESVTAHVYVGARGHLRHSLMEVQRGRQEITVPLQADEFGKVEVSLVMPKKDAFGRFTGWLTRSVEADVVRADRKLSVELQVPESATPAQEVSLSGRVLSPDGAPAQAEVCLFAVDAGMLSVADYELPDLTAHFYKGEGSAYSLDMDGDKRETPSAVVLPALWRGDGVGRGFDRPFASFPYTGLGDSSYRSLFPSDWSLGSSGVGSKVKSSARQLYNKSGGSGFWDFLDLGQQQQYAVSPEPCPITPCMAADPDELPPWMIDGAPCPKSAKKAVGLITAGMYSGSSAGLSEDGEAVDGAPLPAPRLRSDFTPVAVWQAQLVTDDDGNFATTAKLPDTLTTYRVFAVALDATGGSFGRAESEFVVNLPVMITPGAPLFMSTGDSLGLPLTLTNNTGDEGTWTVCLNGADPQQVTLAAGATTTLYFDYKAEGEGEHRLQWSAVSPAGSDAAESVFPVRYPAPLLKERHCLLLEPGQGAAEIRSLLMDEVKAARHGTVEVELSASPLLHFSGCVEHLTSYPYSCTEQTASALLPWIFHDKLAAFCPGLAMVGAEAARAKVRKGIAALLARQAKDGGLGYWPGDKDALTSCPWASAYAGMVVSLAIEQGFEVPSEAWKALQQYLDKTDFPACDFLAEYAAARACGNSGRAARIINRAKRRELKRGEGDAGFRGALVDLEFMAALDASAPERHQAFLRWMKSRGRDYRHYTTWDSGWTLVALAEYLRREKVPGLSATVRVAGREVEVGMQRTSLCFPVADGKSVADVVPPLEPGEVPVYAVVNVKAQPDTTEYPGVTGKGLQVTRVYEVKGGDGLWRPATEFKVGDVVRVTLTCAKLAPDVAYFVLEDYLPACMEAINPDVPGQAAGLDPVAWSSCFDHREYLADRVRGFCTRWSGRDLLNMSYFARVKRAGSSTAPPAAARLMYEPQTYGLSPNHHLRSK